MALHQVAKSPVIREVMPSLRKSLLALTNAIYSGHEYLMDYFKLD